MAFDYQLNLKLLAIVTVIFALFSCEYAPAVKTCIFAKEVFIH